jgi:hypothetical protein
VKNNQVEKPDNTIISNVRVIKRYAAILKKVLISHDTKYLKILEEQNYSIIINHPSEMLYPVSLTLFDSYTIGHNASFN